MDRLLHRLRGRRDGDHLVAGLELDLILRPQVQRRTHRHGQLGTLPPERNHAVTVRQLVRDQVRHHRIDHLGREIHEFDPIHGGHRPRELLVIHQLLPLEQRVQTFSGLPALLRQRLRVGGRNHLFVQKKRYYRVAVIQTMSPGHYAIKTLSTDRGRHLSLTIGDLQFTIEQQLTNSK
jgi:hypothetical protein